MCRKRITDSHWSAAVSYEGEIKPSDEKELAITVLISAWSADLLKYLMQITGLRLFALSLGDEHFSLSVQVSFRSD